MEILIKLRQSDLGVHCLPRLLVWEKLGLLYHISKPCTVCFIQVEQVLRVERMRQAIMEGLQVEFARPPLPPCPAMYAGYPYPAYPGPQGPGPYPIRPAGMGRLPPHPAGRGMPPMGYMDQMGPPEGPPHPGIQGRGRGILGR